MLIRNKADVIVHVLWVVFSNVQKCINNAKSIWRQCVYNSTNQYLLRVVAAASHKVKAQLNCLNLARIPRSTTVKCRFCDGHFTIASILPGPDTFWYGRARKASSEVLEKAAATMGLQPGDCLLFEDSPTGVATAKNANCPVIVLATTHQEAEFSRFSNVLAFVSDFTDLSVFQNENGFGVKLRDAIIYQSPQNIHP